MPAPVWPKTQLLRHGPELPMAERIDRYRHNIRAIRASGCKVCVMPDTLDAKEIEAWFMAGEETSRRLKGLIRQLARLDAGVEIPVSLAPHPRATSRAGKTKGAKR